MIETRSIFRFGTVLGLLSLCGSVYGAEPKPGSWSSFQNGGVVAVDGKLPVEWGPDNLQWQAEITGYGQSTPLILGDQVVVTSTSGKQKEQYHVVSFAQSTGDKMWQVDLANPTPEENTSYVSRAAPTPVISDETVYAFFEGGLLVAVSKTGDIIWQRDLIAEYGPVAARHGIASSLEHDDKHLFVWVERSESPYLLAVAKSSGETVWKVDGVGSTTWSSPRLVSIDDATQHLVCSASGKITGFDPASGERLWDFDGITNNTSCTPCPAGNGKFLIGASDGRGEENAGKGADSNGIIQITKSSEGEWQADFLWRAKKASASFGSPVFYENSAFIVNRVGVLYRLNGMDGKSISASRTDAGGIWATPLVADGKLYLFGQKGTTSIVDLESGKEIATNTLWDAPASASEGGRGSFGGPVLYGAAASAPYLFLRRGDILYAVATQP